MSEIARSPVHQPGPHESALRHVTGSARYVDDLPAPAGLLHGVIVPSPHAHAAILRREATAARAAPGVRAVLFVEDVPGHRKIGPIVQDEPLLADGEVCYAGQPVALVVADSRHEAEQAAKLVQVDYAPLPAILGLEQALAEGAFHNAPHLIARGDLAAVFADAALVLEGELRSPAQDHFYLETQCSRVIPEEGGCWRVISSTQHPTEVQREVASVLGIGSHRVVCEVPRMGGGFGGKESQATPFACLAALGAHATGRPVSVWLNRAEDMAITGKRHPFYARWKAAFAADGRIRALDASLWNDGGWSLDLSPAILDRALYHLDNAYFFEACRLEGRVCRTHLPSNTAFRGFGGPQGMLVVEAAMERAAEVLGLDPAEVRRRSYYRVGSDRTPYGQLVPEPRILGMHDRLVERADYAARRAAMSRQSGWTRRGIGLQPVKFGISFTNAPLNQAGALVLVYADGTVQLNHGGTEMGQGLHTKMLAVCADCFGLPPEAVRVMTTSTEKVPNTSATAASSGSDLNGQAVRDACLAVRDRMAAVAAERLGLPVERLRFAGGRVGAGPVGMSFAELASACWAAQVSMSSTGYYRTPGIRYDRAAGQGTPFSYFAYGVAVVEVEVNGLTGEHRLRRVDILHDVGDSLIPSIDLGQVEGAFVQGYGWLTAEQVIVDEAGRVRTKGPSTYKIPACGDVPRDWRVELLPDAAQPGTIHGSKAVGEPPLMLAIGVLGALRHAIGSFGGRPVELALPATPEAILLAVEAQRG